MYFGSSYQMAQAGIGGTHGTTASGNGVGFPWYTQYTHFAKVNTPSKRLAISDSWKLPSNSNCTSTSFGYNARPLFRNQHGPRMNVLLADGHVEAKGSEINKSITPNNVPDLRMFYTTWEP